MKIASIGGGPAGLYFSILMKKAYPETEITVYERNSPDDTFGWGVVFSDETLGNFEEADAQSFQEIRSQFRYWREIETYYRDTCIVSGGHGFAALSRRPSISVALPFGGLQKGRGRVLEPLRFLRRQIELVAVLRRAIDRSDRTCIVRAGEIALAVGSAFAAGTIFSERR